MSMITELTSDEVTTALGIVALKKAGLAGKGEFYTNVRWHLNTCAGEIVTLAVAVEISPIQNSEEIVV